MKIKKLIAWIVGGVFFALILLGICMVILPKGVSIGIGIAIICLSIAFGIMTVNPVLIVPLALGILMLFIPHEISGIIFIVIGAVSIVANPIVYSKIKAKKRTPHQGLKDVKTDTSPLIWLNPYNTMR